MFVVLRRRLASNTQLGNFSFKPLFPVRLFSSSSSQISLDSNEDLSFKTSYLINSCGLSPNLAKSVSHRLNFTSLAKPDSALKFLRENGFSSSQIAETVKKWPELLNYNVEKTILPKIEFLYSIGLSKESLPKFISGNPRFLRLSLKTYSLQCHDILKSLLHSEEKVIWVLQRLHSHNDYRVRKYLVANVSFVREVGMPEPFLSKLLLRNHEIFLVEVNRFKEAVRKIVEMGFDPAKYSFSVALLAQLQTSSKRWKAKIDLFKSFGLSEDEFWSAFRRQQRWVLLSEDSIMNKMSFLVNNMGWKPDYVARNPTVFSLSLEKRIVPRCAVIRILFFKGLIRKQFISFLMVSEEKFLSKFVNRHLKQVPQLFDILRGKIDMQELGFKFSDKQRALFG